MTEQSKILVTGATGNVGGQVVFQLLDTGASVRALVRDLDSGGLPDGVEVVRGDLSAPDTLDAPLEGVETVFLVWPFLTVEAAPAVLDAVKRHARRIVYLSSMGVRDDLERQADPINQFHADMERLIEQSGLEWTFLRPSGFATNTLGWAEQIRADGVVRAPYGSMTRSVIHERDIASVAVRALADDGHAGAMHVLSGPEVLTQVEQVQAIGEAIGQPLRFEELSRETARQGMIAAWGDPSTVDGMLDAGAAFVMQPERVTSTVEEVTEAPAHTFRQWVTDHADDFR